jgi:hypothetical protein
VSGGPELHAGALGAFDHGGPEHPDLADRLAAGIQASIGSIAGLAVLRDDLAVATGAYGGESMAARSERSKAHIRRLIDAHR